MSSTLHDAAVAAVLARLRAQADAEDAPAKAHVAARERELGRKIYGRERADAYAGAPLAISAEVGQLLYVLALAAPAAHDRRVRHVARLFDDPSRGRAARLAGGGPLITTELSAAKAGAAAVNLAQAGLDDLVELRVGDALDTLDCLDDDVDFLFLDGSNDLYLGVLELVAPRLARGALVVADLSAGDPELDRYCAQCSTQAQATCRSRCRSTTAS